jgi:uncharacterized protein (DUF433 family)
MTVNSETTELERYFEFTPNGKSIPRSIRVGGTRVGREFVLRDYGQGASAEEIALRFPTLTLEQIYATITYYLAHTQRIDKYIKQAWRRNDEGWREQQRQPSNFVLSLRQRLQAQRQNQQMIGD